MHNDMIRARDLDEAIMRVCHRIMQEEDEANSEIRQREIQAKLEAFGVVKIMIEELQKKGEITYA